MSDNVLAFAPQPANTDAQIGKRVHDLIWGRITQAQLGAMIGMEQGTVSRKIRGKVGWSTDELVEVAARLDVTVGYLFGESAPNTGSPEPEAAPSDYGVEGSAPRVAEVIEMFTRERRVS